MGRIILEHAVVLDGVERRPGTSTVVIDGPRVAALLSEGERYNRADGDRVVDVRGMTVMPGMHWCHFHIEYDSYLGSHWGVTYLGAERPPGVLMAYAIKNAKMVLGNGITSVIGAGSPHDIDAQLKMAIEEGVVEGPRMTPCGPHTMAIGSAWPAAPWWIESANTGLEAGMSNGPDGFRRTVRTQISRGAEIVKIYATGGHGFPDWQGRRSLSSDELLAAVQAAHEMGCKARSHVVYRDMILECIEAGVDIIDHGDEADVECVEAMVARGTTWAPSLHSTSRALRSGRSTDRAGYESVCKMVAAAHEAGVPIVPGDDYGAPGFNHAPGIHAVELEVFVEDVGVSPIDAIRMATHNGGIVVNRPSELGIIKDGAVADLLVVRGDPSTDVKMLQDPTVSLAAIIKDGALFKDELPT